MSATTYRGGCLCGSVRYEAGGNATNLCYCHCTSCRRASGAPFVPWGTFARERFTVTQGKLAEYRSSAAVARGFCATCGTSITYRHDRRPAEIDIALATLDDPNLLKPEAHIWVEDKVSWVRIDDGLPQFDRFRSG
jgi:hypothetical protein